MARWPVLPHGSVKLAAFNLQALPPVNPDEIPNKTCSYRETSCNLRQKFTVRFCQLKGTPCKNPKTNTAITVFLIVHPNLKFVFFLEKQDRTKDTFVKHYYKVTTPELSLSSDLLSHQYRKLIFLNVNFLFPHSQLFILSFKAIDTKLQIARL